MFLENTTYQTIVDSTDANNVYYWYAELWRATSSSFWKIRLKNTAGSIVTEKYPLINKFPSDDFVCNWDNRVSYIYWLVPDLTKPLLTTVTIASDNVDPTIAVVWDTITITIVSNEDIQESTATILWEEATIVAWVDDKHWTATYTVVWTETEWIVTFTIDFIDIVWNVWTQVTTTTNASSVTFDKAPYMLSASRQSNTVLFVTLSEDADDATLTQANDWWFTVFETWTPATAYVVSATAKQWSNSNIIELTVADMTASATVWVTVTYATWWNALIADLESNLMDTDSTWVNATAWA